MESASSVNEILDDHEQLLRQYVNNLQFDAKLVTLFPYGSVTIKLGNGQARIRFDGFELPSLKDLVNHRFLIPVFVDYGQMRLKNLPHGKFENHSFLVEIAMEKSIWKYTRYDSLTGTQHKKEKLRAGYVNLRKRLLTECRDHYKSAATWTQEIEMPLFTERPGTTTTVVARSGRTSKPSQRLKI